MTGFDLNFYSASQAAVWSRPRGTGVSREGSEEALAAVRGGTALAWASAAAK